MDLHRNRSSSGTTDASPLPLLRLLSRARHGSSPRPRDVASDSDDATRNQVNTHRARARVVARAPCLYARLRVRPLEPTSRRRELLVPRITSTSAEPPSRRRRRPSSTARSRRARADARPSDRDDGRRWERRRVRSSSRARVVDGDGKRHREAAAEIKTKKEKKKGEGGLATIRGSRRFARGARVVAVGAVRTTRVDVEIGRDDARDRRATDGGPNGGRGWTALSNGRSVGHSSRANE